MFNEDPLVYVTPQEPDTPETLARRFEGQPMSPRVFATLRHDAARLGIERVFIVQHQRHAHLGEMGAEAFKKIVGREPENDDLHRVNCLDAGKVGHFMCGWCDEHGSPRFQCGCVSG